MFSLLGWNCGNNKSSWWFHFKGIGCKLIENRCISKMCHNIRITVRFLHLKRSLWEVSSGSESVRLLARQAENSTSRWGSFWERSPLGSWFSTSAFRNVPGIVPENVRICGFKRNLSNLNSASKIQDPVQLNSWDSFSVTLPSISSGTCAIQSSVTPGVAEFCDWLFLGYSCVSLAIAANFRLFLNAAIILEEGKVSAVVKTAIVLFLKLR